jgi:5-methylcytosine-specific restriction endonuclease McrA
MNKYEQKLDNEKWIRENQRYDILSVYGRIRIKQNLCKRCKSRFFILSKSDDSPYCPDCRKDISEGKIDPDDVIVIFHTEINPRVQISKKIRMAVYERDNYTCVYCNRDLHEDYKNKTGQLTLDHFVPYIGRGEDQIPNLYTCCKRCNVIKYSHIFHSLEEVKEYIKGNKELPENKRINII